MAQKRRIGGDGPGRLSRLETQILEQHHQHKRAGVVVGAVALGPRRDVIGGVLEQTGRVGESPEVVERDHRQPAPGKRGQSACRSAARLDPGREPRPAKRLGIAVGDAAPHHVAAEQPGPLSHRVPPGVVVQEARDLAGNRRGIPKGHEHAAAVCQQFPSVPVGCRDHRLAAAERVGQCARGDLVLAEIGGDVDVGRTDEGEQLRHLDVAIVEDDVPRHAEVVGHPYE